MLTKKRTTNQTLASMKAQPQVLARAKMELRDKIRMQAERAIELLFDTIDGKVEGVEPMRIKACQIVLAKVLPDLSSSDVTVHDPYAGQTAEQLLTTLRAAVDQLDAADRAQVQHLLAS